MQRTRFGPWVGLPLLFAAVVLMLPPTVAEAATIRTNGELIISTSSTSWVYDSWMVPNGQKAIRGRITFSGNSSDDIEVSYRAPNGSWYTAYSAGNVGASVDRWIDFPNKAAEIRIGVDRDGSSRPVTLEMPEVELEEPPYTPGTLQLGYQSGDALWQVRLSWTGSNNPAGTTYEVWRKTLGASGQVVKDEKLGSTTGTSFVTTSNGPGQYYRFRVRAVYQSRTADSPEVDYWTAPIGTVTPGARSMTVSWPAVGNGARYRIYWRVNGGNWSHRTTTTGTSYTFSSLDPNSRYEFALEPELPNGGHPWRAVAQGPQSPYWYQTGSPTFSNATQNGVQVSWSRGSNPSSGVTYRVTRQSDGEAPVEVYRGTSTSFADSSLTPGTRYTYTVTPLNAEGQGPSASGSFVTVPLIPATPRVAQHGDYGWAPVGRGWVVLEWDPVPGATGYAVWVYDGYAYRRFDAGNKTTWDSRVEKIYPTESWINSRSNDSVSSDPFNHNRTGEQLRDDPNSLYQKTAGDTYDSAHNYWFRVSAYNASGESPYSESAVTHTFPDRTDPTPPQGGIVINEGAAVTGGLRVQVRAVAQDNRSGLKGVQLSNDNRSWSNLIPLSGLAETRTVDWMLPAGDYGPRTVYARFVDQAGNTSAVVSDSIEYLLIDTQAPKVTVFKINGGAPSTNSRQVTLTIEARDDQTPQSGLYMRFSNDGLTFSAWEKYQPQKVWTLSEGEGRKQVWVEVQDGAGLIGSATAEIQYRQQTGPIIDPAAFWSSTGAPGEFYIGGDSIPVQFVRLREVHVHWSGFLAGMVRYGFDPVPGENWETMTLDRTMQLPQAAQGIVTLYANLDTGETYSIRFLVDTMPPEVQAAWKGGATVTAPGRQATLAIAAQDNLARSEDLVVSVDGGPWVPWQGEIPVTLSGSGSRAVVVKVADPAGNVTVRTLDIYVLP